MQKLQLSLKTQWFNLTKEGVKSEDYRELTPYWYRRLCIKPTLGTITDYPEGRRLKDFVFKPFTHNVMTLGYPSKTDTSRIITFEHTGIEIRTGNPGWGAEPDKLYFVIKHGKRIS